MEERKGESEPRSRFRIGFHLSLFFPPRLIAVPDISVMVNLELEEDKKETHESHSVTAIEKKAVRGSVEELSPQCFQGSVKTTLD